MKRGLTDYKQAGVDSVRVARTLQELRADIMKTYSPAVLSPSGGFAAVYDLQPILQQYTHPLLVQSVDGIGTKMMIARMMQHYQGVGVDLLSVTCNDILVYGAKPLTLLDYIASATLEQDALVAILQSLVQACLQQGVALVGGETAQMPGVYLPREFDLAGMITGVVEHNTMISGQHIVPGDIVYAFTSSGLHTNGYSLARQLLFDTAGWQVDSQLPEFNRLLGEILLEPHRNYTTAVLHLIEQQLQIKGMAHITGGGILENIPRILPAQCCVRIKKNSWPEQPLFTLLQEIGHIDEQEMYRVFNMGIGYILIADEQFLAQANTALQAYPDMQLYPIGEVIDGTSGVHLCA